MGCQTSFPRVSCYETAASVEELVFFESDLIEMRKSIEFRSIECTFQTKLMSDIKEINDSNSLVVFDFFSYTIPADKWINTYYAEEWL